MSKYTTEVRFICETEAGLDESVGYKSINTVLALACPKIFDFDFPIFDESYRLTLETKILKHYYTREISAETVGLWKLWLETRMNEIMPYYNQLYESALIKYNPLYDTDLTREYEGHGTKHGVTDNNSSSTRNGGWTDTSVESGSLTRVDKYSDTPQNGLEDVMLDKYLTNARVVTETPNQKTTETTRDFDEETTTNVGQTVDNGTTTDAYVQRLYGKTPTGKSYSAMIKEFRETLLNIDMQIIDELKDLFFNLW